jgi:hypothetical protein
VELWGVQNFGDLAALPEAGISERLGSDGIRLQRLARGAGNRPLAVKGLELGFEKFVVLDDPIALTEPLSFVIAGLLNQVCASLQAHALATNELLLRLKLENKTEIHHALRPSRFQRATRKFSLDFLFFESKAYHASSGSSRGINQSRAGEAQNNLKMDYYQPLAPEPEKLELTLARIAKLGWCAKCRFAGSIEYHTARGLFAMRKFRVFRNLNSKSRGRFKPQSKQAFDHQADRNINRASEYFALPLQAEVAGAFGSSLRINAKPATSQPGNQLEPPT